MLRTNFVAQVTNAQRWNILPVRSHTQIKIKLKILKFILVFNKASSNLYPKIGEYINLL